MTQNLGGMKSRRPKDPKAPGVTAKTSQIGQAVGDEKSRTPEDPLTAGTNEVSVSTFEVQFQLVGLDDLVGHTEFWQFEHGFDTLEIHEQGSSVWVAGFSVFCQESCSCQLRP